MKAKLFYILSGFVLLFLAGFLIWKFTPKKEVRFHAAVFSHLPGWKNTDAKQSLQAFQISCKAFLKQAPETPVGSKHIHLLAKDWYPSCQAALAIQEASDLDAKEFFETWFRPVTFYHGRPLKGLFTGYYMPSLKGSLTKSAKYSVPIYSLPDNLVTADLGDFDKELKYHRKIVGKVRHKKLTPYFTRAQIDKGALKKHAPVLAWVDSKVDRQFLEIEGSGVIELDNGEKLYVGYAGENGQPYTPIARVLINKGVMTRDNASMQRIRKYFKLHPEQVTKVLNKNQSFVFFNKLPTEAALGSQGVALTPGYSLAIDRTWVPLGAPIWLNTTRPDQQESKGKIFQRLMIAQDTGGAIRGAVRGDVYWGAGDEAIYVAGHMKNEGNYWMLLPKHAFQKMQKTPLA